MGNRAIAALLGAGLLAAAAVLTFLYSPWKPQPEDPASLPAVRSLSRPVDPLQPASFRNGTPVRTPDPVPLEKALAPDSGMEFRARLAVIHGLPRELPASQAKALLEYLRSQARYTAGGSLDEAAHMALVNDCLNVLQRQESVRAELVAYLEAEAADPSNTPVWRDYALQHLASMAMASEGPGTRDQGPKAKLLQAQWVAVETGDAMLASGAMLRLLAASRQDMLAPSERGRLERAALRLAQSKETPGPARVAALQVCGQLGSVRVRDTAYAIASSNQEGFPLRIAAVATLGQVAQAQDAEIHTFLAGLASGPEKRLRVPAEAALKRLNNPNA